MKEEHTTNKIWVGEDYAPKLTTPALNNEPTNYPRVILDRFHQLWVLETSATELDKSSYNQVPFSSNTGNGGGASYGDCSSYHTVKEEYGPLTVIWY